MSKPVFSQLPVLRALINALPEVDLRDITIVGVQHLLETTGSLIEALIKKGVNAKSIYLLGKCYSASTDAVAKLRQLGVYVQNANTPQGHETFERVMERDLDALWTVVLREIRFGPLRHGTRRIVILDDGGRCLRTIPLSLRQEFQLVGVEQTTAGVALQVAGQAVNGRMVAVASSAAKRFLESPFVADTICVKAERYLHTSSGTKRSCGVVGLGAVGGAVARQLLERGHRVVAFDSKKRYRVPVGTIRCSSVAEVVSRADVVFGCSGTDLSRSTEEWSSAAGERVLISCTSEDIEFQQLAREGMGLAHVVARDPFADFSVSFGKLKCVIAGGGYPINFDRSPESVPLQAIQLTRGLLFAGVVQAARCLGSANVSGPVMLDARAQRFVANAWLKAYPKALALLAETTLSDFSDLDWIAANSKGPPSSCFAFDSLPEGVVRAT